MKMKKIATLAMALAMAATMSAIPAFAAETEQTTEKAANQVWNVDNKLNAGQSKVTLEIQKAEDVLIATVPIELPIVVNSKGEVTVPTDAKIINNSDKKIKVTDVGISRTENSEKWGGSFGFGSYESAVNNPTNNLIGIQLNGDSWNGYTSSAKFAMKDASKWYINADSSLQLNMKVAIGSFIYNSTVTSSPVDVGTLTFTIAYAE